MTQTLFFYDLETSGLNPRTDRIMQFAGQRTDMDLNPIGEAYNVLIRLNDDTLPSPDAVMVTGISPQSTLSDGMSEAEFAQLLIEEVFTPDTITVGFNNIRFDDEFIRYILWRNFHDPYEWAWKDGRSRWDILDVVRMTRALRPNGLKWPVDKEGKATNRLEFLTSENGIEHANAHDALADVEALIAITKLIKTNQTQLFNYLLTMRDKKSVQKLVNLNDKQPFVYVSGRYDAEHNKATVSFPLTSAPNSNALVYDLRHDPSQFLDMTREQLAKIVFAPWEERKKESFIKLPVKVLQYNRSPAVAPLGVLEQEDGWDSIGLDVDTVTNNKNILLSRPDFAEKLRTIFERVRDYPESKEPEAQLYDGFLEAKDRIRTEAVRNADSNKLADFHPEFQDERLSPLLLHYKARNHPSSLTETETIEWESWRSEHLRIQLPAYVESLQRISATTHNESKQFLLQELQLWAEAILPVSNES